MLEQRLHRYCRDNVSVANVSYTSDSYKQFLHLCMHIAIIIIILAIYNVVYYIWAEKPLYDLMIRLHV